MTERSLQSVEVTVAYRKTQHNYVVHSEPRLIDIDLLEEPVRALLPALRS